MTKYRGLQGWQAGSYVDCQKSGEVAARTKLLDGESSTKANNPPASAVHMPEPFQSRIQTLVSIPALATILDKSLKVTLSS